MARMTRCAQKTLKAADGEEPVCSEASTDCNIPLSRHIPAICVGSAGGGAHTREEWLDAASVEDGMCAAAALVCRLPWMCCESIIVVRDGIEDQKKREKKSGSCWSCAIRILFRRFPTATVHPRRTGPRQKKRCMELQNI